MNHKYVYAKENLKGLVLVFLVAGISIFVMGIIALIQRNMIRGISVFIVFFIICCILIFYFMDIIKWRKWHRRMERSGTKFRGFVVGYNYRYHEHHGNFSMSLCE